MVCNSCQEGAGIHEAALTAQRAGADNTGLELWTKAYLLHCRGKCYCQCRMDAYA